MAQDYYELLGVSRTASADEIKKAFRTKAHQFHPDKSTGDAERFKKINEAYQVLSDPAKRQQYDQFGQTFDQARRNGGAGPGFGGFNGTGFGGTVDFGDLGDIFGDMFGFGRSSGRTVARRGRDIIAELRIPFIKAVFGGEAAVQVRRLVVCKRCSGSGAEPGSTPKTCGTCGGAGQVRRVQQTILGSLETAAECPVCHGDGVVIEKKCRDCHGQGRREEAETLTVKIPAGIDQGQRIKLSGKGEAGQRGLPPGDVYLEIHITPDPDFKREGDDIHSTVNIPISTAVLGGTDSVKTIDGPVDLKIPAGTSHGTKLSIKGKGVPHLRGRGRGDHIVTIEILVALKLSAKAKQLFQQLRDLGV